MKVAILLVVLLVCSAPVQSQEIKQITLSESAKNNYLRKSYEMDNYCIYYDEINDTVENYIDGRFDFYQRGSDTLIIFDGELCGGHEKGVVNVYKFSNGEPTTILSRSGKIAQHSNDTLWIYTYPCCAQILNIIVPYSMITGEKLGKSHVFYSREDFGRIFPHVQQERRKYQLSEDSDLRWSNSVTDRMYYPLCDRFENIIGELKKETKFTLLEVMSNGWVLIRLDGMKTSEGYCLSEYDQNLIDGENYILYGWVPEAKVQWE